MRMHEFACQVEFLRLLWGLALLGDDTLSRSFCIARATHESSRAGWKGTLVNHLGAYLGAYLGRS